MFNINGLYTLLSGAFNIFQPANPGAGVPNGTQITAAWLNDVQGELLNPLTVSGVAPAANTPNQVLQALKRIFGGNRTLVTASAGLGPDNAGLVVVNAAGGNIVLTLPLNSAANGVPLEYVFMRTDTSANTVTVVDAGSDTDAPGGATSLNVATNVPLWIRGDGASVWDVVLNISGTAFAAFGVGNREKMFTSSGSWTCPTGITQIYVDAAAGGGGGYGVSGSSTGGAGGGGGSALAGAPYTVVPGTAYPVTIGAGGAGGAAGGNAGAAGGTTSFGTLFSLTGGGGATGVNTVGAGGGAGGNAGSVGGYITPGGFGGSGGGSLWGSGGVYQVYQTGLPGLPGAGFGSGGGGAASGNSGSSQPGGAGAPGFIRIRY